MSHPQGLVGLAYVRIAASDPRAQAQFAQEIVGLQRAGDDGTDYALRSDARARSLTFSRSSPTAIALEAWDEPVLAAIADRLKQADFAATFATPEEARARRVRSALITADATGNAIEIVVGPEQSARRFFGARDAGVTGLANIGLRSRDGAGDLRFWRALGAEASDYAGAVAYLALDDAHHRIALYPSKERGPLYLAYSVASFDDLMRGHYFLGERQVRIVQGPGRQPASEQAFLHFRGPDGLIYAYVHGMARREPRPPRQFSPDAQSLCAWGSRAEDVAELSGQTEVSA
jgi:2,3-dihydroxy-p-cumate/2,3-dihydroxybenzoate 3,4-dioxygenase